MNNYVIVWKVNSAQLAAHEVWHSEKAAQDSMKVGQRHADLYDIAFVRALPVNL